MPTYLLAMRGVRGRGRRARSECAWERSWNGLLVMVMVVVGDAMNAFRKLILLSIDSCSS